MERWGVPVPRSDDEEKTELALSFDDAEFQHDPAPSVRAVGRRGRSGAVRRAAGTERAAGVSKSTSAHEPGSRSPAGPAGHHDPLRRDPPARPPRVVRPAARARLHGPVVGRGRRRRRVHATRPGRRLGARAESRRGHHPRLHPGAGAAGPEPRLHGRRRAGALLLRARRLVQGDRGRLERPGLREPVPPHPGHAALPAHGLQRREGDRGLRDLQGQGLPAGPDPRAAAARLPGRAAPRHAAPGRQGGRRGHPQLAQRRGRRHIRGGGRRRRPAGRPAKSSPGFSSS